MHTESHPLAGQAVRVQMRRGRAFDEVTFVVEDWWDKLTGDSWFNAEGNPAAIGYAVRSGVSDLPLDNEVVYGKINNLGHLIHVSELLEGERA